VFFIKRNRHKYNCIVKSIKCTSTYILFLFNRNGVSRCTGNATTKRHLMKEQPVLIIRVYELCLYNRLSLKSILETKTLKVGHSRYDLAGLTMFKEGHYCAVICSNTYGDLWYDGLIGRLTEIGTRDLESWFPQNAVFCKTYTR